MNFNYYFCTIKDTPIIINITTDAVETGVDPI